MTQSLHSRQGEKKGIPPKTVLLREEFVALTHDPLVSIVLNQLLYWTQRVKDFDLFLAEERFFNPECNVSPRHGWIYKTATDLIGETMICVDRTTMRRYLKSLIDQGWLEERSNPHNKWDKTSQYRLNLRKLQEDLLPLGFDLPGIEAFPSMHYAPSNGLLSNEQISPSNDGKHQDSPSKGHPSLPKGSFAPSEGLNSPFLSTEITTEIKNRDHTQRTRACEKIFSEDFLESFSESISDFENLENPLSGDIVPRDIIQGDEVPDESVAEEMIRLWEYHIVQRLDPAQWKGVLHLTEERKDQLESLFAFHFKNDIKLWERFCLRVKAAPFLMGESPSGWRVTLDWILCDKNLHKVLEGNYDDTKRAERTGDGDERSGDLTKLQPTPAQHAERAAILASITDPVWKSWCSQLAIGVPYNELRMLHEPLSLLELQEIANAWFLEVEDDRLVWIGSSDPSVLRKIDELRLKISWVFKKEYPKARVLRTRLENPSSSHLREISSPIIGDTYA